MARGKQNHEKQSVSVGVRMVPYYGIEFDHPRLRHITVSGPTPEAAWTRAVSALRREFPFKEFNIDVTAENPGPFERAGLKLEVLNGRD